MSFEDRLRMSEAEAREVASSGSNVVKHLLENDDGTFSVMSHIVCETCDYCVEQGDCRERPDAKPCKAKPDPYEKVGR